MTGRNLECMLLSKRSPSEKTTFLYDSNCMTFWKRQDYEDSLISGCQELGMRECIQGAQMMYRAASESILCDTVMMDACIQVCFLSLLFPRHSVLLSRSNRFSFSRNIPGTDQHIVTHVTQDVTCRPYLPPYSFLRSVMEIASFIYPVLSSLQYWSPLHWAALPQLQLWVSDFPSLIKDGVYISVSCSLCCLGARVEERGDRISSLCHLTLELWISLLLTLNILMHLLFQRKFRVCFTNSMKNSVRVRIYFVEVTDYVGLSICEHVICYFFISSFLV